MTGHPKIYDLANACKSPLGIDNSEKVSIAKYIPHGFEWKWMNPDEVIVEKKGKKQKTETKTPACDIDVRKFPYLLKDGDIIGLRIENEIDAAIDDFQTAAD